MPWLSGDVRRGFSARHGCHRERAQPTSPDVFDRRRRRGERHLHLSVEQVIQCRGDAAIGHVNQVDAGRDFEQLADQMVAAANTGEPKLILLGLALAYAMNSGTDLAGTDGFTTMT